MARRVLEADLLAKAGIVQTPITVANTVKVIHEIRLHKTAYGVFSLQFNYSGELLAVGLGTGGIQIFDAKSGKMTCELRPCRLGGFAVMSLHFHPKEPHILYAATTEGVIHVYNIKTGVEVSSILESGNEINTFDFSMDGFNFTTGGKDLAVRLYETKSNQMIKMWPGSASQTVLSNDSSPGNTMRVFSIKFHPINQYIFVSGGWDNHLKIWDVRDNEGIKRNVRGPHVCGDSLDLRESEILSGQWTALHALQEYNYTTGAVTREIMFPHTEGAFIYAAQYLNSDLVVAGGSGTNSAEVIEISTNRHVGGFHMDSPVQAVDSTNQGRLLATAGSGNLLVLLEITE